MVTSMSTARAAELEALPFTYTEVGATASRLPGGYHHLRRTEVIGSGADVFARAADRLLSWQMHEAAGLEVQASRPSAEPGTVVVVTMRVGPVRFPAPCRVIESVRDAARAGFAYGTLPGHPESGEEAFYVEQRADGTVTASVTAFSRPGRWFTRLGGPVGRVVQRRATHRYVDALRPP